MVSVVPAAEGQSEMGRGTLVAAGVGGCGGPVLRFMTSCEPMVLESMKSVSGYKFVEIKTHLRREAFR